MFSADHVDRAKMVALARAGNKEATDFIKDTEGFLEKGRRGNACLKILMRNGDQEARVKYERAKTYNREKNEIRRRKKGMAEGRKSGSRTQTNDSMEEAKRIFAAIDGHANCNNEATAPSEFRTGIDRGSEEISHKTRKDDTTVSLLATAPRTFISTREIEMKNRLPEDNSGGRKYCIDRNLARGEYLNLSTLKLGWQEKGSNAESARENMIIEKSQLEKDIRNTETKFHLLAVDNRDRNKIRLELLKADIKYHQTMAELAESYTSSIQRAIEARAT